MMRDATERLLEKEAAFGIRNDDDDDGAKRGGRWKPKVSALTANPPAPFACGNSREQQ